MEFLVDKLQKDEFLTSAEFKSLLENRDEKLKDYLFSKALETKIQNFEDKVFMRGLIEFTNYCKNNCLYCGIRRSNNNVIRYRLSKDEILNVCKEGYELGYKTFVLQGGEDNYFTDEIMEDIIKQIKYNFPTCAVTLSLGERNYESYSRLFKAGADRYLLRHETASKRLYEKLHPNMSYDNRIKCLNDLKKIGFQVGAGFMVGLPEQNDDDLIEDLFFLKSLNPHMVGIGPFIPQKDTPLNNEIGGTVEKTLILLSLVRLMLPKVLLPATTALGSLDFLGREKALKAGANVVMPNLTPLSVRDKYILYDGKICTGDESASCRLCIESRINKSGFKIDMSRGDYKNWRRVENVY